MNIEEKIDIQLQRALDALVKICNDSLTINDAKNEAFKALESIEKFELYEKLEDL